MDERQKLPKVKSGALGEFVGSILGMAAAIGVGAWVCGIAWPYGKLAFAAAVVVSIVQFFILMVCGAIAGNNLRF